MTVWSLALICSNRRLGRRPIVIATWCETRSDVTICCGVMFGRRM